MAIAILTVMCISIVFFHVSSVPVLQGCKRDSGKFRNLGKVVLPEDSRAGIQTQTLGQSLCSEEQNLPGNAEACSGITFLPETVSILNL